MKAGGVLMDEVAVLLVAPILPSYSNDAGGPTQFVVRMRHVQGGQQFAKRQITCPAKNNDVLGVGLFWWAGHGGLVGWADLNQILFQEDVFVREKLGMQRQQRSAQGSGVTTYFASQYRWSNHAVKTIVLHGLKCVRS